MQFLKLALTVVALFFLTGFGGNELVRGRAFSRSLTAASGLSFPRGVAVDAASGVVYWTDRTVGAIRSANLDGSNVRNVLTGLAGPRELALDTTNQKIYWIQVRGNGHTELRRANYDGSVTEVLVASKLPSAQDLALDLNAGKIYFTDLGRIGRVNLNGSNMETLVSGGLISPQSIALDLVRGKMYWTDEGANQIKRANLNGSNVETVINSGLALPYGLAVDAQSSKIYWTDHGTDKIERASLTGTNREILIQTGLEYPLGIALDTSRGRMYWADAVLDTIQSARLNGSSSQVLASFFFSRAQVSDYDKDRVDDFAIWRGNGGYWAVLQSATDRSRAFADIIWKQWGLPGDLPLTGDFDSDERADLVVYRPGSRYWFVCPSSAGFNCSLGSAFQFGLPGDNPTPADFDGDGVTDYGIWRPTDGYWWYRPTGTGVIAGVQWGLPGDLPVPDDYDGDGADDFAIWRPNGGYWAVRQSSKGSSPALADILWKQWGLPGDHPMPGNYDSDSRADLVVYRPAGSYWFLCESSTNYDCSRARVIQWGLPGDIPVQADFDGDGLDDIAVWRPADGNWFYIGSQTSLPAIEQWGLRGDYPLGMGIADQVQSLR